MNYSVSKLKKINYKIVLSDHATKRMNQRNITEGIVIDSVLSLKLSQLKSLTNNASEAIVIDKETKSSVVLGFNKNGIITVITVINKSDVYVLDDTVSIAI